MNTYMLSAEAATVSCSQQEQGDEKGGEVPRLPYFSLLLNLANVIYKISSFFLFFIQLTHLL